MEEATMSTEDPTSQLTDLLVQTAESTLPKARLSSKNLS